MNVRRRSGSEGPSYDPYGYTEFTVKHRGHTYVLHYGGLLNWLKVDGMKVAGDDTACVEFTQQVGLEVCQVDKYYWRLHTRCKKCGCRQTRGVDGYPGETLNICIRCGSIVSTDMDWSAIE